MSLTRQTFFRFLSLFLIVFLCAGVVLSQDEDEPPPPPVAVKTVTGVGNGIGDGDGEEEEEAKGGAIVRGRAFYEDSGKPVRRGWIGFVKIREFVEKKDGEQAKTVARLSSGSGSYDAEKYVLTNDQGEFVIKGVKAGVYVPMLKVKGVLNPDYSDRQNPLFQQIEVDGVNEVQVAVGVKRGGAVSGRILYQDGEPVIGAKVQILKKQDRMNEISLYTSSDSITVAVTDDRGFYRFAGLPADEYLVRVTEPSVHSESAKPVSGYETAQFEGGSQLRTFYPSVSNIKDAKPVAVVLGQEAGGVDIQIPDRRLFRISGSVVAKNNKNPLKGMKVTFEKIVEGQGVIYNSYDRSKQTGTDEQGTWAFKDLPKGKYRVSVSREDSGYYSFNSLEETKPKAGSQPKFAPLAKEIEIEDKDLQDLVFELAPEASISGTITVDGEKPFPNYVGIFVFDQEKKINSATTVGSYGGEKNAQNNSNAPRTFRIGELSEGKFVFNAASQQGYYIKSIKMGSADLMKSPLELKDGQEVSGVQIVLGTDVAILKGKVNNHKPGARAFVIAIPVDAAALGMNAMQRSSAGVVMPDGGFEVKAAPGEYFVIIGTDKNRPDPAKQSLDQWLKDLVKDAMRVTLKPGETETISLTFTDK